MRKYILVPVLITAGSAGAFLMRLSQMRTGFEALTGLPVPHDPWQYVLPVFLLILAVLLALAVSRVPESAQPPAAFYTLPEIELRGGYAVACGCRRVLCPDGGLCRHELP